MISAFGHGLPFPAASSGSSGRQWMTQVKPFSVFMRSKGMTRPTGPALSLVTAIFRLLITPVAGSRSPRHARIASLAALLADEPRTPVSMILP